MPVIRSAQHQGFQLLADQRRAAQNVCSHLSGPVAFLIPWQQISGQRQRQRKLKKDDAEPEVYLARRTIGAINHHLHEVQDQQHGHHLGRPMVQPPQEMPAGHVIVDVVHTLPRGLPAGTVAHPQEDAGDELNHQGKGQRTAPHVAPARATGYIFKQHLANVTANARTVIQPIVKFLDVFHALGRGGG